MGTDIICEFFKNEFTARTTKKTLLIIKVTIVEITNRQLNKQRLQ